MKPYTDLMIDLETLDTAISGIILEVGFTFFDRNNTERKMAATNWYPQLEQQAGLGRTFSTSTLNWWTQDHPEEWRVQMTADRFPLEKVLNEMAQAWQGFANNQTWVWAKGTPFDVGMLRSINFEPWSFRRVHDMRTLKEVMEMMDYDVTRHDNNRPHSALHDSMCQAQDVQEMISALRIMDQMIKEEAQS